MQRKACFMSLAILLVLSANASAGSFMKSFNKRTAAVEGAGGSRPSYDDYPIVRDHRQPDLTNVIGNPVIQPVKKPPITTTIERCRPAPCCRSIRSSRPRIR